MRILYFEGFTVKKLEALAAMPRLAVLDLVSTKFKNLASLRVSRSLQTVRVSPTTLAVELESVKDWNVVEIVY